MGTLGNADRDRMTGQGTGRRTGGTPPRDRGPGTGAPRPWGNPEPGPGGPGSATLMALRAEVTTLGKRAAHVEDLRAIIRDVKTR